MFATLTEKKDISLKFLSSKIQVRELFSECHIDDIEKALRMVQFALDERLAAKEAKQKEETRKKEAIQAIVEMAHESEIAIEDIIEYCKNNINAPRQRKYTKRSETNHPKVNLLWLAHGKVQHKHRTLIGRLPTSLNDFLSKNDYTLEQLIFTDEQVSESIRTNELPKIPSIN